MKDENKFKNWHSRGFLPHCDRQGLTQFITFRLGDSLPVNITTKLSRGKNSYTPELAKLLDNGLGSCMLKEARNAEIVQDVLLNRDGIDYNLHAWSIMPNHVHTMLTPDRPLEIIIKAWKSVSSRLINNNSGGSIWYADYFDRYIRNESHYIETEFYIDVNPVKADLCRKPHEWIFSSAYSKYKIKL